MQSHFLVCFILFRETFCSTEVTRNHSINNTMNPIEDSRQPATTTKSQEPILTVTLQPSLPPFVERKTENPGGFIGKFIRVLQTKFKFEAKYDWTVEVENLGNFSDEKGLRMAFNLVPSPRTLFSHSPIPLTTEGIWIIAIPKRFDRRNILILPLKTGISLHFGLLAIYTPVVIYLIGDLDISRSILRLFGLFFGVAVGWLPKKIVSRFLAVLWCFTTYVLVQAYLATLTSELSSPIIDTFIEDIWDLMNSGIRIYCFRSVREFHCNLKSETGDYICKNCVTPPPGFLREILPEKLSMNKSWQPFALSSEAIIFDSYFVGKSFTRMRDPIGTWPAMIYTNVGRDFLNGTITTLKRLFEAGIVQHWLISSRHFIYDITSYQYELEMLNMTHLNDVLFIAYFGWSSSILIFIIELLKNWYRNNSSA